MNRIRTLREEKNISQKDLGKMLNVAQNTISNWEKGLREPDNKTLVRLSKIFECSTDYILGNSDIRTSISTIAAHHDGDDYTEEELADIEKFKEFVRSRRKSDK